ncbi:cadherin repeat domain-containing protein, partial [Comamonas endophytica]
YTVTSDDSADVSTGSTRYSLKLEEGTDGALFSIDEVTGAVTLNGNPDYEAKAGYSFTVVATDAAGNASEQVVTLAINNVDDTAPAITSGGMATAIDENSGAGQVVYTVTSDDSADVSTGSTRYSLKLEEGTDGALFSIDEVTGAV